MRFTLEKFSDSRHGIVELFQPATILVSQHAAKCLLALARLPTREVLLRQHDVRHERPGQELLQGVAKH